MLNLISKSNLTFTSNKDCGCDKKISKSKNINTVIMVTPDVPKEAITAVSFVCDYIVVVDEIKHPTKGMKTEKQKTVFTKSLN
jgi:hypothetical protein